MKTLKALTALLGVLILISCSTNNNKTVDDILNSTYRVYHISGYAGPNIDINQDSLARFLVALHYDIPLSDIENELNWSAETTEKNIDALIKNKVLTKT